MILMQTFYFILLSWLKFVQNPYGHMPDTLIGLIDRCNALLSRSERVLSTQVRVENWLTAELPEFVRIRYSQKNLLFSIDKSMPRQLKFEQINIRSM